MFQKVLIAVDGSVSARQAIPVTAEIAKKFNSAIVVLHVHERDLGRAGAFPLETEGEARHFVAEAVTRLGAAGVSATGEVRHCIAGHAAREIVDTARSQGADLIVMGSRGPSDIAGILLGSVTHKVTRLAHVPVLVVREAEVVRQPIKEPSGAGAFA